MVSTSAERGLENCPAMRPILTTGQLAPKVSTADICRMTRNMSRMLSALNSAKLSAQSPPCRMNTSPAAARARLAFSLRASPANTSGGNVRSSFSTRISASGSGYSGCCLIGMPRQLSGVHFLAMIDPVSFDIP